MTTRAVDVYRPIRFAGYRHPFDERPLRFDFDPVLTIDELLMEANVWPTEAAPLVVTVDGVLIHDHHWATYRPFPGAHVIASHRPRGVLIASAIGGALAGTLVGGLSGLGVLVAITINLAISVALSFAMRALTPGPKQNNNDYTPAALSPTLRGTRNQAQHDGPIWNCYGTTLLFPPYASKAYTEIVGRDSFLRVVLCPGFGPWRFSPVSIGGAPVSDIPDVEVITHDGDGNWTRTKPGGAVDVGTYPADGPPDLLLFPSEVHEDNPGVSFEGKFDPAREWEVGVYGYTVEEADEITIDLSWPQGLYRLDEMGNGPFFVEQEYRFRARPLGDAGVFDDTDNLIPDESSIGEAADKGLVISINDPTQPGGFPDTQRLAQAMALVELPGFPLRLRVIYDDGSSSSTSFRRYQTMYAYRSGQTPAVIRAGERLPYDQSRDDEAYRRNLYAFLNQYQSGVVNRQRGSGTYDPGSPVWGNLADLPIVNAVRFSTDDHPLAECERWGFRAGTEVFGSGFMAGSPLNRAINRQTLTIQALINATTLNLTSLGFGAGIIFVPGDSIKVELGNPKGEYPGRWFVTSILSLPGGSQIELADPLPEGCAVGNRVQRIGNIVQSVFGTYLIFDLDLKNYTQTTQTARLFGDTATGGKTILVGSSSRDPIRQTLRFTSPGRIIPEVELGTRTPSTAYAEQYTQQKGGNRGGVMGANSSWDAVRAILHASRLDTQAVKKEGLGLLELRIRSNGQFSSAPDAVNVVGTRLIPIFDYAESKWTDDPTYAGDFEEYVETRNPAWVVSDLLKGRAIERKFPASRIATSEIQDALDYCEPITSIVNTNAVALAVSVFVQMQPGYDDFVDDDDVAIYLDDGNTFYTRVSSVSGTSPVLQLTLDDPIPSATSIGNKVSCPKWLYNRNFDFDSNQEQSILDVLGSCYCAPLMLDGVLGIVVDADKNKVQQYNARNILGFGWDRDFIDETELLKLKHQDERKGYQNVITLVYGDGYGAQAVDITGSVLTVIPNAAGNVLRLTDDGFQSEWDKLKKGESFALTWEVGEVPNTYFIKTITSKEDGFPENELTIDRSVGDLSTTPPTTTPALIVKAARHSQTMELPGCTRVRQAWSWGRRFLATLMLRAGRFRFRVGIEHFASPRGSRVGLSHYIIEFGLGWPRVLSVTTDGGGNALSVTVDIPVPCDGFSDYGITYRRSAHDDFYTAPVDGTATGAGDAATLVFATPIPTGQKPEIGDLLSFGLLGTEELDVLVQSVQRLDDFQAVLTCIPYVGPALFEAGAAQFETTQEAPRGESHGIRVPPPQPKVQAVLPVFTGMDAGGNPLVMVQARVAASDIGGFDNTTTLPAQTHRIRVEYRDRSVGDRGGVWRSVPDVSPNVGLVTLGIFPARTGVLDVRAAAISMEGMTSTFDVRSALALIGFTFDPDDPLNPTQMTIGYVTELRLANAIVPNASGPRHALRATWVYASAPYSGFAVVWRQETTILDVQIVQELACDLLNPPPGMIAVEVYVIAADRAIGFAETMFIQYEPVAYSVVPPPTHLRIESGIDGPDFVWAWQPPVLVEGGDPGAQQVDLLNPITSYDVTVFDPVNAELPKQLYTERITSTRFTYTDAMNKQFNAGTKLYVLMLQVRARDSFGTLSEPIVLIATQNPQWVAEPVIITNAVNEGAAIYTNTPETGQGFGVSYPDPFNWGGAGEQLSGFTRVVIPSLGSRPIVVTGNFAYLGNSGTFTTPDQHFLVLLREWRTQVYSSGVSGDTWINLDPAQIGPVDFWASTAAGTRAGECFAWLRPNLSSADFVRVTGSGQPANPGRLLLASAWGSGNFPKAGDQLTVFEVLTVMRFGTTAFGWYPSPIHFVDRPYGRVGTATDVMFFDYVLATNEIATPFTKAEYFIMAETHKDDRE